MPTFWHPTITQKIEEQAIKLTHNRKTLFQNKTNVLQNSSKKQEEAKVLNVLRYEKM
jgi:hypothetical protein